MSSRRLFRAGERPSFEIRVDGQSVTAFEGETIAAVMLAAGMRSFHVDARGGDPSRLYCGMGLCLQCLITVNGEQSCRACQTAAEPGMRIETGR